MRTKRSTVGVVATASLAAAAPCDIYASGNTPCVAAHSSVRALFDSFNGPLYQVTRNADGATTDVYPLEAGGVANAATQDNFCTGSTCSISIIYDQTANQNDLTKTTGYWSGPLANRDDEYAGATGAPVTLNGQKAYGIFVSPGVGYRISYGNKTATGDEPEGIYAVLDGTHYNGGCCFDYGNAETSDTDTGSGHMEAIYFGNNNGWGYGNDNGPWVMADLENGLFSGENARYNNENPIDSRFLHAIVKGEPNQWAIRAGDATQGTLTSEYNGPRPTEGGYNPMHKEGSIILGIGGDNSNEGQGTFYEGVMTSGYPSDDIEDLVHQNIISQNYATTSLVSGPAVNVDSAVSIRVTTPGYNTRYLAHNGSTVDTQVVTSSDSTAVQQTASWNVVTGLANTGANSGCVSFESVDTPGSYIRHYGFHLVLNANDGSVQFGEDATFCPEAGLNGQGNSIRSWSYPMRYFRHYGNVGYAAMQGGPDFFDDLNSYQNDVSFVLGEAFAS